MTIVHAARILNAISSEHQTKCGSCPLASSDLYPFLSPLWLPWQQGVRFKQCHCGLKPLTEGERRPCLCLGETRCGQARSDMQCWCEASSCFAAARLLLHKDHSARLSGLSVKYGFMKMTFLFLQTYWTKFEIMWPKRAHQCVFFAFCLIPDIVCSGERFFHLSSLSTFFFLLRKPRTQPTSRRAHNVDEMLMYPLGVLPRGWTWTYRTTLLNHQVIYFSRFHLPSRSVQCSVAVNGLNRCREAEQSTIWTAVCAHYTTLYWDEQKNRTVWALLLLLFYADNKVQF